MRSRRSDSSSERIAAFPRWKRRASGSDLIDFSRSMAQDWDFGEWESWCVSVCVCVGGGSGGGLGSILPRWCL